MGCGSQKEHFSRRSGEQISLELNLKPFIFNEAKVNEILLYSVLRQLSTTSYVMVKGVFVYLHAQMYTYSFPTPHLGNDHLST